MKIDRYKMHPRFDAVELVIDPDGSVCYTRDVEKVEAKCAELEAKCAELLEACEGLLGLAERHGWLHVAVNQARVAIAKAKGAQP